MGCKRICYGVRFDTLLAYIQTLSAEELADAELVAGLKCRKQLRNMVAGAKQSGAYGAVHFLSLCQLLKEIKEVRNAGC